MGLPEPIEPQPDDVPPAGQGDGRADWLCGPEEGLEAEMRWREGRAQGAVPAPRLFRPGDDSAAEPAPAPPAPGLGGPPVPAPRLALRTDPDGPAAPAREPGPPSGLRPPPRVAAAAEADPEVAGFSHGPAMLWEPGANSVPTLSRAPAAPLPPSPSPPGADAPAMDFPMDDAEERARAKAEAAAAAAAAAEQAARPHAPVAPDAFDLKDAPVPWWMQVPQLLREDRRVQGLAAGVVLVLMAVMFWPRPEASLSIGSIRRDPVRFDGQDVRVSGRVGEVFEVGGGHAFYLHQGRDTIVVFTRSRTPRRGEGVTLVGMVSTGYLNGQSGSAIFESAKR